ncbi:MAG: GMC family oxidoreductase [Armatimonadetes bacterium]|nr:GMC family oxidoreductase [Armatimonadota bacterium]
MDSHVWDYIIVGSGFGGSVCALRLCEKGYRVLVLEKGRRLGPDDFPRTNWDLARWMWAPSLGMRGPFRMSFLPHVTALSGVGVGGGSLVYANTLPIPKAGFYRAASWSHLADWEPELEPHYQTARKMLGAVENTLLTAPDLALQAVARKLGLEEHFRPTTVGVYFGQSGETVPDPYFGGLGPERTGCTGCGGCMIGCRYGAKNTLDKNYLYLAEKRGLTLRAETEVRWIKPDADGGYVVETAAAGGPRTEATRNVVLSGGVMGTIPLLLRLKAHPEGLPRLSDRLGSFVRTNNECLIGVTSKRRDLDMSKGVAIGAILETDEHSHMEVVRYSEGSDFFRLLASPHVGGRTALERLTRLARLIVKRPGQAILAYLTPGFARSTIIMLYMRTQEGHLRLKLGRNLWTGFRQGITSAVEDGAAPTNSLPEATDLARLCAEEVDGFPQSLLTETLLGIPTTAHILGGACMGKDPEEGVLDPHHRVFGYPGLFVVDGSSISANPGVNPALTICALAERAMAAIPSKAAVQA